MSSFRTVVGNNLSEVWGRAFLNVFQSGEISPLTVEINEFDDGDPPEIPSIRKALDANLDKHCKGLSCHQVANTIFPSSLWNPKVHRNVLYERYQKIYHRIRRHPSNRYGVYFQRFISYGDGSRMQGRVNQLEHIIQTWTGGNHRRSALQAAVFDPYTDHTHQHLRGFPCLQQVAFAAKKNSGLVSYWILRHAIHFRTCLWQLSWPISLGSIYVRANEVEIRTGYMCGISRCAFRRAKVGYKRSCEASRKSLGMPRSKRRIRPTTLRAPMFDQTSPGQLIVLEGPDGVGKSTLSCGLHKKLMESSLNCEYLAFPGKESGTIGRLVYDLHHETGKFGVETLTAASLQTLHIAAHLDVIEKRIRPALDKGEWVILDRFWWSTWVYGRANGMDETMLDALIQVECIQWKGIKPSVVFLIDRVTDIPGHDKQVRLREGYIELQKKEHSKYPVHQIKNDFSVQEALNEIMEVLRDVMSQKSDSETAAQNVDSNNEEIQLRIPLPGETPFSVFTKLYPAEPTVVYDSYWRFAVERQEVFFRKTEGRPGPWTNDHILRRHKFTNAYRASDRVSQYLIQHVIL